MTKTFPQESSEAFLKLKKSALRRTKKTSPTCSNRVLWKHFEKRHRFVRLLNKETFWHSPTCFE